MDGAGNLYIADSKNNVVREVSAATGYITTVAGNGTANYSGDGGAATSAELNQPSGVAMDGAGDMYIADFGNNRIREVNATTGYITTVAGNGTAGSLGDTKAATSAELTTPKGVALDSAGNLYIADFGNNRIREVNAATGNITTVVGNGTAGYIGDGGASTSAELTTPNGVALDNAGNIYIADLGNNSIRKVNVGMAPAIFSTPTPVNTTDGPQTVTVSNIGNAALTFASNPTYPANFPENGSDLTPCLASSPLAMGGNCDVSVNFAPTAEGSSSGTISLTDNALNVAGTQQTITLQGTATVTLTIAPGGALTGGKVGAPYSQTLTTTGGTAPYTYSSSALPAGLR